MYSKFDTLMKRVKLFSVMYLLANIISLLLYPDDAQVNVIVACLPWFIGLPFALNTDADHYARDLTTKQYVGVIMAYSAPYCAVILFQIFVKGFY